MAEIFIDGDFTTVATSSSALVESPFQSHGDNAVYVYKQDYTQFIGSYSPIALNTAHPVVTMAYLVDNGNPRLQGGRVCSFTRTYAKIPATQNVYETFTYRFIGLSQDGSFIGNNEQRDPFSRAVQSKVVSEFYLVGSGGSYATAGDIPLLTPQEYLKTVGGTPVPGAMTNYLYAYSSPTKDEYLALRDAAASSQSTYNLIAEGSFVEQWMGNIYKRTTRYIKAL